jgi:hypothetical protein
MPKFNEIKKFPNIHYKIDVSLDYIEFVLKRYSTMQLNLNPDFQRGHVWTKEQQIAYMEFLMRNPQSGKEIYFNHPNWMSTYEGDFVLVDGKQRLHAALAFLHNEIPIYGYFFKDWSGSIPEIVFSFNIASLKTRAEVLQWYIDFNIGGTPHSSDEILKVQHLLKEELK